MQIREAVKRLQHSLFGIFLIILLTGYVVTFWSWQTSKDNLETSLNTRNQQEGETFGNILSRRFETYQEVLRGSASLLAIGQGQVSRAHWQSFVDSYDLTHNYRGLVSVGLVMHIPADQLDTHINQVRADGLPTYSISVATTKPAYDPVVYAEPQNATAPFGFDMSSSPVQQKAMEQARDANFGSVSDTITNPQTKKAELLLFYPIYSGSTSTLEQRRANIRAYAFASIQVDELFASVLSSSVSPTGEFAVAQGGDFERNYIYKTSGFDFVTHRPSRQTIDSFGKQWSIETAVTTDALSIQERSQPRAVLLLGLFMATLFALFVAYIMQVRGRDISFRRQLELQEAKDELLSLASHQLRTPATGVKQYVGMVLEGYAGKVPSKQRNILKRAYESNERQLETVNQILHIARIESGRLPMEKEPLILRDLVRDVAEEQRSSLHSRKQRLKTVFTKNLTPISADPTYFRMVVENLLSNASKYTHEGGSIAVTVSTDDDSVVLEISDTGVGIASEDIQKLFQKFSRIHNELSIRSGGTGIGLYLTKLIVELHDGTIEVISRPQVGTTFRVTIPKSET